jgi:predicted nucleic acid-binding Zn ribbon protein
VTPDRQGRSSEDGPTPIADALRDLGSQLGLPEPDLVASLGDRWAEVVGPAVATHARPRDFRNGTLTIAVDAPAWATELRYLEEQIRARLAAISGQDSVRRVRVVVDPPR